MRAIRLSCCFPTPSRARALASLIIDEILADSDEAFSGDSLGFFSQFRSALPDPVSIDTGALEPILGEKEGDMP